VSIHSEHPFLPPPEERDAVRQFRGRLPAPVTVVTTGAGPDRVGLTVSSLLIVAGDPGQVVALVDPDSDLGEALAIGCRIAVSVLTDGDGLLADTFGGVAPAPGGPFTVGSWTETAFGPVRTGVSWIGAQVTSLSGLGWSVQVTARIEHVALTDSPALIHQRGRYRV
jgi:flavin reductase (DIM6/NTAB) family NADH-FMN oxidoreductase RutF